MGNIIGSEIVRGIVGDRRIATPGAPAPAPPAEFDAADFGAGDGSDVISWVTSKGYTIVPNGASISTIRDRGPGAYFWDTAGSTSKFYEPGIDHFEAIKGTRFKQRTVDKSRFNRLHQGPSSAAIRIRIAEAFDDELQGFFSTFSLASSQKGVGFYIENRTMVVGGGLPQIRLSIGQAVGGSLILAENSGGVALVPGFWYTLGYSVTANRVAFYVNGEQVREVTGLGLTFTTGDCSQAPTVLGGTNGTDIDRDVRHSALWSSDIGDAEHAAIHDVMVAEEGHSDFPQAQIVDIAHHLRANRAAAFSGAKVATWESIREGGADATQGVSAERPTYNEDTFGIVGQFGVEFTVGADHMEWDSTTVSTTWSWCYYGKIPPLGAIDSYLFDALDGADRITLLPTSSVDDLAAFDYDGTRIETTAGGALDDDEEHFVALVSDASAGEARWYIDGALAGAASVTNIAIPTNGNLAARWDGALADGSGVDLALAYVLDGVALDAAQAAQLTEYHRADSGYAA